MKKYLFSVIVIVVLFVSAYSIKEQNKNLETEETEVSSEKCVLEVAEERAKKGDSDAMFLLGYIYSEGIQIEIDTVKSIYWLDKAIELDNTEAMYYKAFESKSFNIGIEEMTDLCKRGAKLGNANCMQALAMLYGAGLDGNTDDSLYYHWLHEAAKAGNPVAMYNVALFYYGGNGVKENHKTAMEWFKKGTEKLDEKCMLGLAEGYLYGDGIAMDREKGVEWAKKSAALGNQDAFVFIAELFKTGIGLEKDMEKANKLYKASDDIKSGNKDEAMQLFYEIFPELEKYTNETVEKISRNDVLVRYIEKLGFKPKK